MSKFFHTYKKYMIRPIVYKTVTKALLVLVVSLIWKEYVNTNPELSMVDYVFPVLGIVLIAFSWFHYIALDGLELHYLNEDKQSKKESKFRLKDIIDFTEEKPESFSELDKEEEIACKLASNVITGLLYILISVIMKIL